MVQIRSYKCDPISVHHGQIVMDKNIRQWPNMKTKDIPMLKQQVLDMLPITQSDVWKKLGIGHRDGSKLISIMTGECLIKKTRQNSTFLLEHINEDGRGKKKVSKKSRHSPLLSKNGTFSPCCGCGKECDPAKCLSLAKWITC